MERKLMILLLLAWAMMSCSIIQTVKMEPLEPKLVWKKEFVSDIQSIDFAEETGEVIISLKNGEVIIYNKEGTEKFHGQPQTDRWTGNVGISKDGKYFLFKSGYTWEYAAKNKMAAGKDGRTHFYKSDNNQEQWNIDYGENMYLIFPDGLSIIIFWSGGNSGNFIIFNTEGKAIFNYDKSLVEPNILISSDSNYFAVGEEGYKSPLTLFKRDGTKLWERGIHWTVASISEGASYITTYPYILVYNDVPDSQNSHKGIVYDKNGNKVMEGWGVLSGNGKKIAMLSEEKTTIMSLPDKVILKEIPGMAFSSKYDNAVYVRFSHNSRYLVLRNDSGLSVLRVFDLENNEFRKIKVPDMEEYSHVSITREGKYLLVSPGGPRSGKSIYYYQLY